MRTAPLIIKTVIFCPTGQVLLFGLIQIVNTKIKAAPASLEKSAYCLLKFLNSSYLLKQQKFFNAFNTWFSVHRPRPCFDDLAALIQCSGLFLSIPESKQNLSEKEKFRRNEEITPSKLGFVKMTGEDKNQPWIFCFVFALRQRWRPPAGEN